jgi:hypothetical protein
MAICARNPADDALVMRLPLGMTGTSVNDLTGGNRAFPGAAEFPVIDRSFHTGYVPEQATPFRDVSQSCQRIVACRACGNGCLRGIRVDMPPGNH